MIARFQTQLKSSSTTRGFSSELCNPGCSSEWKKSSWELECCHFKTCTIVIGALPWPILKQMVYTPWMCMQPWSFRRYHCKLLVCSTDDIRRKKNGETLKKLCYISCIWGSWALESCSHCAGVQLFAAGDFGAQLTTHHQRSRGSEQCCTCIVAAETAFVSQVS